MNSKRKLKSYSSISDHQKRRLPQIELKTALPLTQNECGAESSSGAAPLDESVAILSNFRQL